MKNIITTQSYLIIIVLFLSQILFAKEVTVKGTVKAAATNQPVPQAMVVLFGGTMDMSTMPDTMDTVITENDGTFELTITVTENANVLFSGAHKEGFLAKTAMKPYLLLPMPTQINLGDILLKTIADAKDTLTISGSVIDSITKDPIAGAKIRVTSGLIGDITIDSLTSGADGKFVGRIPYIPSTSPLFNAIFYGAEKDEYTPKGDTAGIPSNEIIDLGAIELVKINIAVRYPFKRLNKLQPTHIAVYSLNGKLLYEGLYSKIKIFNLLRTSNRHLIVRYYRNDKLLGTIKDLYLQ